MGINCDYLVTMSTFVNICSTSFLYMIEPNIAYFSQVGSTPPFSCSFGMVMCYIWDPHPTLLCQVKLLVNQGPNSHGNICNKLSIRDPHY